MKIKILRNCVIAGSVWFAGHVWDVPAEHEAEARAAIERGDAAAAEAGTTEDS